MGSSDRSSDSVAPVLPLLVATNWLLPPGLTVPGPSWATPVPSILWNRPIQWAAAGGGGVLDTKMAVRAGRLGRVQLYSSGRARHSTSAGVRALQRGPRFNRFHFLSTVINSANTWFYWIL